ncbi:hypothetical protein E4U13_004533 [Claviceps humidiphila]|uniref:MARVEL domain-containing protein n=1 Tax=Claviceps humidiphila TaxID=1294629 RepID=A0A9P7TP20_9HYPO|nr:hypothetical protein E4U13_004533 [Claviceps humidiphila]
MSEHREPPTSRARVIIYTILRALQVAALITIITITARHVSYMKAPGFHVPPLLAAILAFAVILVVYCAIAYFLYWAVGLSEHRDNLIVYICAIVDGNLICYNGLVAFFIWYYYYHKQTISCNSLNNTDNKAEYLRDFYRQESDHIGDLHFVNADRATCVEYGHIFKLLISLCILFFASVATSAQYARDRNMDN